MFGKKEKEKKELEDEIKDERIDLAEFIEKSREDAKEKLDEALSKDKMEFCARCGRKVDSRMEWGGKCIQDGCTKLVCIDCWETGKKKCKEHTDSKIVPIKEEPRKESKKEKPKEAEKEEKDEESRPVENIVQKAVGITNDENIIMGYASDYRAFVRDRLVIYKTLDFSPNGYFEKGKFRFEDDVLFIYKKRFIFKKGMLRIHIIPFARYEPPLENHVARVINSAKRGTYNIFIFVTDTGRITKDVLDLINRFESMSSSVFFYDAQKRKIYRSSDGLDLFYSSWFDPEQKPMKFVDLAKIPSEMTGNIAVLPVKGFARYLKMDDKKALKILKNCKFLKRIKGSDSFMFKF